MRPCRRCLRSRRDRSRGGPGSMPGARPDRTTARAPYGADRPPLSSPRCGESAERRRQVSARAGKQYQIAARVALRRCGKSVDISWTSGTSPISGPLKTERDRLPRVPALSTVVERVLPLAVLALSAISVQVMGLSPSGAPRLRALSEEKRRVDVEISRLGDQIRRLRVEVRPLKSDPARVEQVARDELGLLRQTEIVVQFGP